MCVRVCVLRCAAYGACLLLFLFDVCRLASHRQSFRLRTLPVLELLPADSLSTDCCRFIPIRFTLVTISVQVAFAGVLSFLARVYCPATAS